MLFRIRSVPIAATLVVLAASACAGSDSGSELTPTSKGVGGAAGSSAAGAAGVGQGGIAGAGLGGGGGSTTGAAPCATAAEVVVDGQKTGTETCASGEVHLADDVASCPFVTRPGITCEIGGPSGGGPPQQCTTDGECGAKGRCNLRSGGAGQFCQCDSFCAVDADCPTGSTCVCGAANGACVKTACSSDKDCTGGALCLSAHQAPAAGACGTPPPTFACTTAADACSSDAACGKGKLCVLDGGSRRCVDAPKECPPVP